MGKSAGNVKTNSWQIDRLWGRKRKTRIQTGKHTETGVPAPELAPREAKRQSQAILTAHNCRARKPQRDVALILQT